MRSNFSGISDFVAEHKQVVGAAALLVVLCIPLLPRNPFYQDLIIQVFFWATLASAWNLLGGFAGQISLGHAAFFGIGAYTSTILYLTFGLSPWIGMFAGAGLAVAVALVVGLPCFRLTSHFFALATLAFAEVLRLVASYWRGLTNGGVGLLIPRDVGFKNFIFDGKVAYSYVILAMLIGIFVVTYLMKHSRLGYSLVALREEQHAAESLGVDTQRTKMISLVVSVFFTALGGTFYAQYYAFIDPDIVFTSQISIQLALLSIIGGVGTILGPVIGAMFLVPLDVFLRGWLGGSFSGMNFVIYGFVLICAVRYFPFGIYGWLEKFVRRHMKEPACESSIPGACEPALETNRLSCSQNRCDKPLMMVNSISKRFGGLEAVKDLSFSIHEGEILGLIGPNGAGKTTVFNLISGFITPHAGTIYFEGRDITSLGIAHRFCREGIGRTFQIVKPFQSMTVLENVMVGAFNRVRDVEKARQEALEIVDRIHLSQHVMTQSSHLTLANRKRLELGRALATRPRLLLLDEVMAGLNPRETEDIISVIRSLSEEGITILMIEHVMKAVMALSDRVVVINSGMKIVEGLPEHVTKDKRVIDAYLGEQYHAATV